jgi:Ca2+-binding EF-hand superfamily protein
MSGSVKQGATIAFALMGFLALGGCALAGGNRQQMAQKAGQRFDAADTDHDGYLSRGETHSGMPRIAGHFDEIDTDRDGQLSKAEILAYLKQHRAAQ